MNPKKIWANLPARDVETIRSFYDKLGFRRNRDGGERHKLASFVIGEDNFVVHFFAEERFKEASVGEVADMNRGSEIMFTLSAGSREEVDQWAEEVRKAGGTVISEPETVFDERWYGCAFADPEGHKWNIFYGGM